ATMSASPMSMWVSPFTSPQAGGGSVVVVVVGGGVVVVVVVGGEQVPKLPVMPALLVGVGQASANLLLKFTASVRCRLNVAFPGVAVEGAAPPGIAGPS